MPLLIYLRGGGDLASGVALRLHRAGLRVVIAELPHPLVVRRLVSFANAIFEGQTQVEEVQARRVAGVEPTLAALEAGIIPLVVDPQARLLDELRQALAPGTPIVLVDGRMLKQAPDLEPHIAELVIGLGPGFIAGENCHAVIETKRGHYLGRVIWEGIPEADTGVPESVSHHGASRVLRAPAHGPLVAHAKIGDHLEPDQLVAEVAGQPVGAPFRGVLRGLMYPGSEVWKGLKIGDVDPRDDPRYCRLVSDKSLAIGGAVLEALLSRPRLRPHLWKRDAVS
jgi:xanthine dehydrogenase accessory factor